MKVLIIGAGFSGLFTAYELLRNGVNDVVVIDAEYPGSGGSLRNVGCFRSSFTSTEHVVLMKRSIEKWLKLRETLGLELEMTGYLWIARRPETMDLFNMIMRFHRQHGVLTRALTPLEAGEIQPGLNTKIIEGAMFDPTAGRMPVIDNFVKLYTYLRRNGVKILPYTRALRLVKNGNEVISVETERGVLNADIFVVTAGGRGTREILSTIDISIPIIDQPRHPLITEPYAKCIKPALIVDWDTKGAPYLTQTEHGGIILARDIEEQAEVSNISHRIDVFKNTLKPLVELLPFLKYVNISRYWIGYYEMTPDHHPIYGPVEPFENLYIATGFSGHGLMMAPVTGEILANWILRGRPNIDIAKNLGINRFRENKLIKEMAIVG
ncbi:MAG: FAD-binding oxidoreductase [Desulfurococcaceae archaeon]